MKVSDLLFADYAAANENGKFTLVGAGFSNINAPSVPYLHRLMFVLVRLQITRQDLGRNRVEVRLVGDQGVIFKTECHVEVGPDHGEEYHLALPIAVQSLRFDRYGDYVCEVLVNGQPEADHVLRMRPVQSAPNP